MKNLYSSSELIRPLVLLLVTLFFSNISIAQIRLDVEGDVKIRGKLDIAASLLDTTSCTDYR